MSFKGNGIYHITHINAPVRIALSECRSADGTLAISWGVDNDLLDHMWLIQSVSGETDTYTLRNMFAGTYLTQDLQSQDGSKIVGSQRVAGNAQKWIIKNGTSGTGFWKIQNKNGAFVELKNGNQNPGADIQALRGTWDDSNANQRWTFRCLSLTSREVLSALDDNPYLDSRFRSYVADGLYLILSQERLKEIWRGSGLPVRPWREQVFDCDDFAFVYKAEVHKWGDTQFKATGFGILCGVMFGLNGQSGHAYNWMVKSGDHTQIEFFEPQNNTFMDNIGYDAFFGVF